MSHQIDSYTRAVQQKRMADAISDANTYDVAVAIDVIKSGKITLARHRDLFVALAAAAECRDILDAVHQIAAKRAIERDADVDPKMGKAEEVGRR